MLQTLITGTVGPVPIYKYRPVPIQSTVDRMWFRISTKIGFNSTSDASIHCTLLHNTLLLRHNAVDNVVFLASAHLKDRRWPLTLRSSILLEDGHRQL